MKEADLIYDWNSLDMFDWSSVRLDLNDETLRDGLQSPSAVDPVMEDKIALLHLMVDLGIAAADIGLPGAGPKVVEQVRTLASEIATNNLPISPNCAARTLIRDVEPIVRLSQEIGIPIEAATFIGSSPVRQYTEDWSLDKMLRVSEEAVKFAVSEGLPVMFVTEDTTRAMPETITALYRMAIECGARRICISDTVGHATPSGVRSLVKFIQDEVVKPSGEDIKIDWHGHRDRGMGVVNCLAGGQR